MKKSNAMIRLKNAACVAAVPLSVFVLLEVVCMIFAGSHIISTPIEFRNLIKTTCVTACATLALSLNISVGRMDFSLGATQMIACVVGGNIAISRGLGPIGVMCVTVLFGMAAGGLVGLLFVITRIPSMVLGLGMALIYECLSFAFSVDGLQLYGKTNLALLSDVSFEIVVVLIVIALFVGIFGYTRFGYNYRSIRGSQTVAINAGINVFSNCIICYVMAGGLTALSGLFDTAYKGVLTSQMGLASAGAAFAVLLPVFVGNFIARYTNVAVAMLIGAFTTRIYSSALTVFALPTPAITALNYAALMVFLFLQIASGKRKASSARALRYREAQEGLQHARV